MSHKIIGVFEEMDGKAFKNFKDLKEHYDLIGSLSGDVGDVEIYYDRNGKSYVVAHDCEGYYGEQKLEQTK